jgi:ABC-2 type transport system permease protein
MNALLRAEWLKLVTTPTYRRLVYGTAAAMVLGAFIGTAQGPPPWGISQPLHTGAVWSLGSLAVILVAVVVGSHTFTQEFAYDTIAHTVIADPGRRRSMVAKAAVAALASILIAGIAAVTIAGTIYAMAVVTSGDVVVHASDGQAVLSLLVAAAVMGVLGVGVGALVRHPLPVLVGVLMWLFVAENVLGLVVGPVAGFLPGKLAVSLSSVTPASHGTSTIVTAGAIAAYAAAISAVGMLALRRRDVL